MSHIYPQVKSVKRHLSEISEGLPYIKGRNGNLGTLGKVDYFDVADNPESTMATLQAPYLYNPQFRDFASWFIEQAFILSGEDRPVDIGSMCGVVGDSGQMLDYLHVDPSAYRITATISDSTINPSTQVCRIHEYDYVLSQAIKPLIETTAIDEVPRELLLPQVGEGGIVLFVKNQAHAEQTLPTGTAKIAFFATLE